MKFDINESAILNLTLDFNTNKLQYEQLLLQLEPEDEELEDAIATLFLKIRSEDINIYAVADDRLNYRIRTYPEYESPVPGVPE